MINKKYNLGDLLDFIIYTFAPAILIILQTLDFSYFLFDYGIELSNSHLYSYVCKIWLIIALIASYRLHYCKHHKRMILFVLLVQFIGYFESYLQDYIIEANVLIIILLYESLSSLIKTITIFITQSKILRKIKILHYATNRRTTR